MPTAICQLLIRQRMHIERECPAALCQKETSSYARTRKIEDYSDSPGGATSNADVPSRSMAFSTKPDLLASSTNSFA